MLRTAPESLQEYSKFPPSDLSFQLFQTSYLPLRLFLKFYSCSDELNLLMLVLLNLIGLSYAVFIAMQKFDPCQEFVGISALLVKLFLAVPKVID